jgi:hypothetical protein
MLSDEGRVGDAELKGRKFNFMVDNTFLTGTF